MNKLKENIIILSDSEFDDIIEITIFNLDNKKIIEILFNIIFNIKNCVLFKIDNYINSFDLKIVFHIDTSKINDVIEIIYYKEKFNEVIIKQYSK